MVLALKEHLFQCVRALEKKILFQLQNSMTDVFVTSRPPCLCPSEGHEHGVCLQSSINLGDTLLRIAREWRTADTWFLAKLFLLQSSILSQILEFFYWIVTIFILITWLVKTENLYVDFRNTYQNVKVMRTCVDLFISCICLLFSVFFSFSNYCFQWTRKFDSEISQLCFLHKHYTLQMAPV